MSKKARREKAARIAENCENAALAYEIRHGIWDHILKTIFK